MRIAGIQFGGRVLCFSAALVFIAGCASVGEPARADRDLAGPMDAEPVVAAKTVDDSESVAEALAAPAPAAPADDSDHHGSGSFINEQIAARVPQEAGPPGESSFNFEGEPLLVAVKMILGDVLQQNYVVAPGVQGTVTFSTAKPVRADQALSILEMLLRWNNATLVWQDGRYTVLPMAQAVPGNLTPRTGPVANARGYEVRAVPLKFIGANAMAEALKPYAVQGALLNVDPARNLIVLGGTRSELENYLQTVEIFDVDWLAGMSVGVYRLQQAEAAKVVGELEKIFGEGGKTPISGMFRFLPLEGVNGVMVITPQPKYLESIRDWIERFDSGGGEAGQRLYVYDVKNAKADDLASTLSEIFGGGSDADRSPNTSAGVVAPGLDSVQVRSLGPDGRPTLPTAPDGSKANDGSNPNAPAGPAVDRSGGIALGASEQVRISAVEESNAVIVRATASQWESIRRVIQRLDQIPLQVHIEAQILQVSLNDQLEYGVQWFFENAITGTVGGSTSGQSIRDLADGRDIWGSIAGSINAGTTSWSFVGPQSAAVVKLLDSVSNVEVLSRPSLVVLNNKAASINVGTQIPVVSTFLNPIGSGTTGSGDGFNSSYVQFRDTGITLSVTPRVNPGGLVFLEIDQKDSVPGASSQAVGGNVPVDQRTIKTEVAVQSGQTLILGGLIKQTDTSGSSGVPGLHRLPIIGALFGGKNRSVGRQELLVLITPKVIHNEADAQRVTDEYRERFRALRPLLAAPQP